MAKKKGIVLLMAALVLALGACSSGSAGFTDSAYAVQQADLTAEEGRTTASAVAADGETSALPNTATVSNPVSVEYGSDDLEPGVDGPGASYIDLAGDAINLEGEGATANGSVVTIASAGTYVISGTLDDGQIIVDAQDEDTVYLVLDGAEITCSTSAPIYVSNADKTIITLADGTANTVTDGASFVLEDAESDEPNAAVFSHDDLTINGGGTLTVNANYNNGIASKDDLKITGGTITVSAVNDGIRGRDSVAVLAGTITVDAGGDGIQSNNDEDAEKGYISIAGGSLDIVAGLDGIQAETSLLIEAGELTIVTGGGSVDSGGGGTWGGRGTEGNPNSITESAKGLKAGVYLGITGGTIEIDSLDDAIHSNSSVAISGGDVLIASGDDGIHADATLTIDSGNLGISRSYEGLESQVITINDGTIHVEASDDAINASSGNGEAANWAPVRGQGPGGFESGDNYLYINGGYVYVDAYGDGIDVNGSITMTAGTVIVNGPTGNGDGPLDYLGTFDISGGYLVAVGSSGMSMAPSTTSTQYSVMYNFASAQAAGTMVHIEDGSGGDLLTFVPTKQYQSVVVSSPELENGSAFVVYSGGSSTGAAIDGLYAGGSYSGGTQVASLTITGVVTGAGQSGGGFRGGPGFRP